MEKNTKNTTFRNIRDPENEIRSPSNFVETRFAIFLGGEKNLVFRNVVFFVFFFVMEYDPKDWPKTVPYGTSSGSRIS